MSVRPNELVRRRRGMSQETRLLVVLRNARGGWPRERSWSATVAPQASLDSGTHKVDADAVHLARRFMQEAERLALTAVGYLLEQPVKIDRGPQQTWRRARLEPAHGEVERAERARERG
jgi:hypothetical protein